MKNNDDNKTNQRWEIFISILCYCCCVHSFSLVELKIAQKRNYILWMGYSQVLHDFGWFIIASDSTKFQMKSSIKNSDIIWMDEGKSFEMEQNQNQSFSFLICFFFFVIFYLCVLHTDVQHFFSFKMCWQWQFIVCCCK